MPKINYIRTKVDPYGKLKVLLAGKRAVLELTNVQIASVVGQSHPTVKSRIANPNCLTMDELRRYAKALQITREELLDAMPTW